MKTFFKRHVGMIILIIIVLVFPTSLSNQAKLNMRIIITGLAIDKTDDKYQVTAQIVKATPGNESPGTSATIDFVSDESSTLADAMSKLSYKSGKVSAFSHTNFVILGEGIREEKATKCLDYFIRDKIVKASTMVVFSEGKASDEIKKTKNIDLSVGLGIQKAFLYKEYESDGIMTTILEFVNECTSHGKSAVASVLKLQSEEEKSGGSSGSSSGSSSSGGEQSSGSSGSSGGSGETENQYFEARAPIMCFSEGKYVGKLEDEEEVFGYMMASKRTKAGDFVLENVEHESFKDTKFTIMVKDKMNFSKLRYEDGIPCLDLTLVVNNAEIIEVMRDDPLVKISSKEYKSIEKAIKKTLAEKIAKCFEKAKEMNVDIFDAYELAYKYSYGETKKLYDDPKNFVKNLRLNADVVIQKLDY